MVPVRPRRSRQYFRLHRAGKPTSRHYCYYRIRDQVAGLVKFPETGRRGRIEGTRELVINRTSYIAAYRILGDTVRILRVLHGAQLWPDEMPED